MALGFFIPGGGSLWTDKSTLLPSSVSAGQKLVSGEVNQIRDALYDVRNVLTGTASNLNPALVVATGGSTPKSLADWMAQFSAIPTSLGATGTSASDQPTFGGEFLTGVGWTSTGWTGSWPTGWAHTPGNGQVLSYPSAASIGTKYHIAYNITGRTAGSIDIQFGGQTALAVTTSFAPQTTDPNGYGSWDPTATTTAGLTVTPTTDFNGTFTVSITPITAVSTPVLALRSFAFNFNQLEVRINNALSVDNTANTFLGWQSGSYTTSGYNNTGFGEEALRYLTSGHDNTFMGTIAGKAVTTGIHNSGLGSYALRNVTAGSFNTAFGSQSLRYTTTGSFNAGLGYSTLVFNATGTYNTAVGQNAGRLLVDGINPLTNPTNSVFIGYDTRSLALAQDNEIVIGSRALGEGTNSTVIGNSSTTSAHIFGTLNALVKATGSTTSRSLADRATDYINLADNGCACDGVTDDYAALLALVTRLGGAYKTLVVPGPTVVNTPITIPANLTVQFINSSSFFGTAYVKFSGLTVRSGDRSNSTYAPWVMKFNNDGSYNEVLSFTYNWRDDDSAFSALHPQWADNTEARYVAGAPPNGLLEKHWNYISIDRGTRYRPMNFDVNLNTHDSSMMWLLGRYRIYGRLPNVAANPTLDVNTAVGNESVQLYSEGNVPLGVSSPAGGAQVQFNLSENAGFYVASYLQASAGVTTRWGPTLSSRGFFWNGATSVAVESQLKTFFRSTTEYGALLQAGPASFIFQHTGLLELSDGMGLRMQSPNGNWWKVTVNNSGVLTVVPN